MKTTGDFTILTFDVPYKKYNEPIEIIPFGDIHHDSDLCDHDRLDRFCDEQAGKDNALYLGMGDYLDGVSTSERGSFNFHALHDATHTNLDKDAKARVKEIYEKMKFMKGRMIGLMNGNHYWTFRNGTTTDHYLAGLLDTNYLGVSSFIRLIFRKDKHHANALDLWVHHGKGVGATPGSSVNTLDKMRLAASADIYLMGHDHKRSITPLSQLRLTSSRRSLNLESRKQMLVRTGSFLKGYEPGKSSYIADAACAPCDLGVVRIIVTPRCSKKNKQHGERRWLDLEGLL